ncbi:hypothetical protein [Kitasatospora sp. MAP5-34]|uniref:hypothetical protein n=1 Tax=Kitasatospora sp. MAP5-34 TaxID=3035102 RepID=UPI002473F7FB|nr:hypothetical protein [Kitasatospora sp. MAP5-34]MDH6579226.1 hypothetical protein [Kitasatospora sp. MAP5-34]
MRRPPAQVSELARNVRRILGSRAPARIWRSAGDGYRVVVDLEAPPDSYNTAQVLALQAALADARTWGVATRSRARKVIWAEVGRVAK